MAEEYVRQFGNLARTANTLVVPANLSDIASMIALATKVFDQARPAAGRAAAALTRVSGRRRAHRGVDTGNADALARRLQSSYFVAVFAVGFALGALRVTLVVPALGERIAELAEMPFMIAASVLFAWQFVRRWRLGVGAALAGGVLALALLLGAELALVVARGLTLEQYIARRDPVAGAAYVAALVVFMLAPAVVAWRLAQRPRVTRLAFEIRAPRGGWQLLDRVAQHRARHVPWYRFRNRAAAAASRLPTSRSIQPTALWIRSCVVCKQQPGDRERVGEVALFDEPETREDRDAALPQVRGAR